MHETKSDDEEHKKDMYTPKYTFRVKIVGSMEYKLYSHYKVYNENPFLVFTGRAM